jgi:Holliday junction resolvase RusA-like endonuclease
MRSTARNLVRKAEPLAPAFTIEGDPVGAPRMTRRDHWLKRPVVVAYFAWCAVARRAASGDQLAKLASVPRRVALTAFFAMPAGWSAKRRRESAGTPHRVKPDADNVSKALMDALFDQDQAVSDLQVLKRWDDGAGPRLVVRLEY